MTTDLLAELLEQARAWYRFGTLESFEYEEDGRDALCWQVRLSHVGASSNDVFVDGAPGEPAISVLARALALPDPSGRQPSAGHSTGSSRSPRLPGCTNRPPLPSAPASERPAGCLFRDATRATFSPAVSHLEPSRA